MPEQVIGYSYLRFSKPEQIKGDSIRRQVARSAALCARHGWRLDESLTLRDLGKSAYTGENSKRGALGRFLDLVDQGKVQPGSVLIVEVLDRLTRMGPLDALGLFSDILKTGVNIATFEPERVYTREDLNRDVFPLMEAIVILFRGYDESRQKGSRLQAAWVEKRVQASNKIMTRRCPAWLTWADGKFHPIPPKVQVVKRIVRMAIDGMGDGLIAKTLNQEQVATLTGIGTWCGASINKCILRSRSLIGEIQPRKKKIDGKREPVGDPIPDYYPAILLPAEFYRLQAALDSRKRKRGRVGTYCRNLFMGIIKDARTGQPLVLRSLAGGLNRKTFHYLANGHTERGAGDTYYRFPYATFEKAFLRFTTEIAISDLLPSNDTTKAANTHIHALEERLADIDHRLAIIKRRLDQDSDLETLLDMVIELETKRKRLRVELEEGKRAASHPTTDSLAEAKDLIELLTETKSEDLLVVRLKLRAVIRALVKDIRCVCIETELGSRKHRAFVAQVNFVSGASRRIVTTHCRWAKRQPTPYSSGMYLPTAEHSKLFDLAKAEHAVLEKEVHYLYDMALQQQ